MADHISHDIHAETRAKIDEDISRLTQQLLALRSARNDLAPISRLPMELMREIFLLARNSAPGEVPLILSWVSHKWRDMALGIAHLWNYIDFPDPDWIRTCLIRSRNVPLDV
ncbi:hypothetical protein BDN72DRAFT_803582, partial [Pluteus cervinus]